jgi:hypothetical protein
MFTEKLKDTQIFNMTLEEYFSEIIEEQVKQGYENSSILKTTKTRPIVKAIITRNPITFYYSGPRKPKKNSVKAGYRVKAEAVALGLNKKGNLVLRAYINPPSVSKKGFKNPDDTPNHRWRTFMLARMSSVQIQTNEFFDEPRPLYNGGGDDALMSITYVTTDFSQKLNRPKTKINIEPLQKVDKEKKPTKTVTVTKQTRNFDKEIGTLQDDLANIQNDMVLNNNEYKKVKGTGTPDEEKYLNILKDLTDKKKEVTKSIDSLVDDISKAIVDKETAKAKEFMRKNANKKPEPEIILPTAIGKPPKKPVQSKKVEPEPEQPETQEKPKLPEIPKTNKPEEAPEDNEDLNEGVLGRIKKLFNKMEYL